MSSNELVRLNNASRIGIHPDCHFVRNLNWLRARRLIDLLSSVIIQKFDVIALVFLGLLQESRLSTLFVRR